MPTRPASVHKTQVFTKKGGTPYPTAMHYLCVVSTSPEPQGQTFKGRHTTLNIAILIRNLPPHYSQPHHTLLTSHLPFLVVFVKRSPHQIRNFFEHRDCSFVWTPCPQRHTSQLMPVVSWPVLSVQKP